MDRDVVFDKLRPHIVTIFEVDESSIDLGTNLSDDLEADSLDLVELIETLGDEFGIAVRNSEIKQLIVDLSHFLPNSAGVEANPSDDEVDELTRQVTVGTLVDFVASRI